MLKNNFKYIPFLLIFIFASCAKRGSITGGFKDTIAPVLKMSFPKNFSTNFKGNEIKLTFDEYIKMKDLNKQLIISPPMKYAPLILPTNASKYISIKINDTLQPNTTYSFNFGQSIQDNNEGNPYNQFKYIFSTGNQIDSLKLNGSVKDAYAKEVESFMSVMLYDANEKINDSVVYKEFPRYITNTLDSLKTFKLENLKAGKYLLVAMKDYNSNTKFNPSKDKIGFHKQYISIPNDSTFELKLFKEVLPYKAFKPTQASGNRLIMGYEGKTNAASKPSISLKNKTDILSTIITKFPKKDSLQIWFNPLKVDSLAIHLTKDKYQKEFTFKIKDQKKDSLKISAVQGNTLKFKERFTLETSTPLTKFNQSKIKIINKDSVAVNFKTDYDDFNQQLFIDFKKDETQKYEISLLPGALTDYMERTNDSLRFTVGTKSYADYGNLSVNLQNVKRFPIILELTNERGDVIASEFRGIGTEKNTKVDFNLIDAGLFTVRMIYDDNNNQEFDSGNYLEKRQPEEVIYFSKSIDVRTNWDVEQIFDVSIPYVPEPKKKEEKRKAVRSGF
jgi:uncharacterized protein (DUF2141 family)